MISRNYLLLVLVLVLELVTCTIATCLVKLYCQPGVGTI